MVCVLIVVLALRVNIPATFIFVSVYELPSCSFGLSRFAASVSVSVSVPVSVSLSMSFSNCLSLSLSLSLLALKGPCGIFLSSCRPVVRLGSVVLDSLDFCDFVKYFPCLRQYRRRVL